MGVANHHQPHNRRQQQNRAEALRRDMAALMTLGRQLQQGGRIGDAASCYRRVLHQDIGHLEARNTLAMLLRHFGDPAAAQACMRPLLALDPANPALPNMSMILLTAGDTAGALVWARRSVRLNPMQPTAWNALGNVLRARALFPAALVAWSQALAVDPGHADALGNMAALLRDMEYAEPAERALRRALQMNPQHPGLLNSLAHVLQGRGRPAEIGRACRTALALAPGFADAWCNLGLAAQQAGQPDAAAVLFRRAAILDNRHALARFNDGLLTLERGGRPGDEPGTGWTGYGWRFAAGQARPHRRFALPEWRGEPLAGKRLFIWREQGVGDELLFASCYADAIRAAGRDGRVVIECERRLTTLFARSFPAAVVRAEQRPEPGVVERVDCDYHIPAGSLPGVLRRTPGDFPARSQWLYPDPNRVALWAERLDRLGPGLRVGVAWRSGLVTLNRKAAYAPLAAWRPVLTVPGAHFISLQHGDCHGEIAAAEQAFDLPIHIPVGIDLRDDFEGTAGLTASLDLVIAPAVTAAELAGGLGVPVWRFGARDWTQLGTGARPWAPAMRQFHPLAGEGLEGALTRIGRELRRVAG